MAIAGAAIVSLGACGLVGPRDNAASRASLHLAIGVSNQVTGGPQEAFDQANTLWLRLSQGSDTRLQQTLDVSPQSGEIQTPLNVQLKQDPESFLLEAEIRRGSDALFRGSSEVQLHAGENSAVSIDLVPVPASLSAGAPSSLTAYGDSMQLHASVLFVTGDTIPGQTIQWSSLDPTVATSSTTGLVIAVSDGDARVVAASDGLTDTVLVHVHALVNTVTVDPPQGTVPVNDQLQFTATSTDAHGHTITGRPTEWVSSDPSIATIDNNGLATGQKTGSVIIRAVVDSTVGSADLNVVPPPPPPPTVTTLQAGQVTSRSAQVSAVVNPNGSATTAWFEWQACDVVYTDFGQSISCAGTVAQSGAQAVGSGTTDVTINGTLSGLQPGQSYQFWGAAQNTGGVVRGAKLVMTMAPAAPTVTTDSATLGACDVQGICTWTFHGTVNPNGASGYFWIEYDYGSGFIRSTDSVYVAAGTAPTSESVSQGGLPPSFSWRAAADNSYGVGYGGTASVGSPVVGSVATATVPLSLSTSGGGGSSTVVDKANNAVVGVSQGGTTIGTTTVGVTPQSGTVQVPVDVNIPGPGTYVVSVGLRTDTSTLFQGSSTVQLQPGQNPSVGVDLTPVPGGVTLTSAPSSITAYGDTVRLQATVVFATGDPLPGGTVSWSSQQPAVATVDGTGLVTSVGDGSASIVASSGSVSSTTTVNVYAVVQSVSVQSPESSTTVGSQVQFSDTPTDANGNPITGRSTEWVSSDPSIATIDANGLATANKPGTVTIRAVVDSVVGSTSLSVGASGDDDDDDGADTSTLALLMPGTSPPAASAIVAGNPAAERRRGVADAAHRSRTAGQDR